MWYRRIVGHGCAFLLILLLAGLLGATLARFAPGFESDERQLDSRLSGESIRAIRQARGAEQDLLRFYAGYLGGLLKGDLGVSRSLARPVRDLLAERIPRTAKVVAAGLALGWLAGLTLAALAAVARNPVPDLAASMFTGLLLCLPVAVLALLFLHLDGPVSLALALVILPRVFRYVRNLLRQAYALPHVLMAYAKGLREWRVLLWHVGPAVRAPVLSLAGVSVSMALGAVIPIEAICDSPGIGQLAWQAALGRDLPLLVNLTALVTAVTLLANSLADLANAAWDGARQ
jgi:peptide/nickel transport system permease protein